MDRAYEGVWPRWSLWLFVIASTVGCTVGPRSHVAARLEQGDLLSPVAVAHHDRSQATERSTVPQTAATKKAEEPAEDRSSLPDSPASAASPIAQVAHQAALPLSAPANDSTTTLLGVAHDQASAHPIPPTLSSLPIDLGQALAMAGGRNPQIALAQSRYRAAVARYQAARTLWLPSLRAGVSYNHHDGQIQDVAGSVIPVNRSALNAGFGTRSVGAGSPAAPGVLATFHASDAIFEPRIQSHAASARNAATTTATNDTLLATSLAYLELLRATQLVRIAEQTRDNAQRLADLTAKFAQTGQGPQADADRLQTELVRRENDVSRAQELVRVAQARLCEFLRLDPTTELQPLEPDIVPIDLESPDADVRELVATGLSNRPELAEAQHLVCEAVFRYRREKFAPLVPSVLLGVSQSGFGGGVGSSVDNFSGRFDVDAAVFWELRNLGFGETARRQETRAIHQQVLAQQSQVMDRVAREVVESHVQVQSRQQQIELAQQGVSAAQQSYDRNVVRIREGQGLPIEVLQSLQALDESHREYLRTLVDYNEAQFRLQRALGWAPHAID